MQLMESCGSNFRLTVGGIINYVERMADSFTIWRRNFSGEEAASFPLGHYATNVTFTHHLSPCGSMVKVSHWSSEGYRLHTYVTFTYHLSPCGSMVKLSHWSSEGYRLYTYVVQFIFYILHLLLQHLTVYQNITHRFTYIYLFT